MKSKIALSILAFILPVNCAFADSHDENENKERYTLFNPTPDSQLRQMTTDRPNVTASPLTVDAGHYQAEVGFAELVQDVAGTNKDSFTLFPTKLKVGLLNNTDLEVSFIPFERDHANFGENYTTDEGFGDKTNVLVKTNLWGNDSFHAVGSSALAVIPYIKFPTGTRDLSNDHIEGGLKVPFGLVLPADFNLGAMGEIDQVYNTSTDDYGTNFLHTLTVGHSVPELKDLTCFLEYIGVSPHETGISYQATASLALVYALSENWTLDSGYRFGLSDDADNSDLFAGTSLRF